GAGGRLRLGRGLGANLGHVGRVFAEPYLVADAERALRLADALGEAAAVILQSNGMLAVGQSVAHACVQALFLEETAQVQLLAQGAALTPRFYSVRDAARRHGEDRVHEPLRGWEYYVAVARGSIPKA